MLTHAQTRASDRRIWPLAPEAQAALHDYLVERVGLMDRVCALLDDLDPPPQLRRTVTSIARLAASVRRRADMLLAVITRPPSA